MILPILVGSGFLTSLIYSIKEGEEKEKTDNKNEKKK